MFSGGTGKRDDSGSRNCGQDMLVPFLTSAWFNDEAISKCAQDLYPWTRLHQKLVAMNDTAISRAEQ